MIHVRLLLCATVSCAVSLITLLTRPRRRQQERVVPSVSLGEELNVGETNVTRLTRVGWEQRDHLVVDWSQLKLCDG